MHTRSWGSTIWPTDWQTNELSPGDLFTMYTKAMHPPYRGRLGQVIFINQQALTDVFGASTFLNLITFTYILILRLVIVKGPVVAFDLDSTLNRTLRISISTCVLGTWIKCLFLVYCISISRVYWWLLYQVDPRNTANSSFPWCTYSLTETKAALVAT